MRWSCRKHSFFLNYTCTLSMNYSFVRKMLIKPFILTNLSTSDSTKLNGIYCFKLESSSDILLSISFAFNAITTSSQTWFELTYSEFFLLNLLTSFIIIGVFIFPYFSLACSFESKSQEIDSYYFFYFGGIS